MSDLSGTPLSTDGIQLTFTAPADDPGAAWPPVHQRALSDFELRYSSGSLTSLNFSAVPDVQFINAGLPGERQVFIVEGLEPSTEYRFAMVSRDQSDDLIALECRRDPNKR